MKTILALAGFSGIKLRAHDRALDLLAEQHGLDIRHLVEVKQVPAKSLVNEEPVSCPDNNYRDEALIGARNRSGSAQEQIAGSYGIGIESGLWLDTIRGEWFDYGTVVITRPDGSGNELNVRSDVQNIPKEYVEEAKRRGFDKSTAGQIIAERNPGAKHDDPHQFLGGKSRAKFLAAAIVEAFRRLGIAEELLAQEEARSRGKHRIRIGNEVRELDIVNVSPTLNLAVLDVLGDWPLNVAAGELLAKRIKRAFPNVEALLMPDGKANGLLQAVGAQLRVPTYVARKVVRPVYAGANPVVIQYGGDSATSQGKAQKLVLSAKHAASLAGKNVVIVDDVVSTGASLDATARLAEHVGAKHLGTACMFLEGQQRPGIVNLGLLPLY